MTDLPAGRPPFNPEAAPFWEAAADGRLVLPVCDGCGLAIWYPRAWCPVCGRDSVTWTEMSGRGTVYACTVIRKARGPWAEAVPYVGAYVELEEGPRILTNVVTDDPDARAHRPGRHRHLRRRSRTASGASPRRSILRFTPAR